MRVYFKALDFIELSFLNSNPNSLFESLSIKDSSVNFLVDLLMCMCISYIALKILKSISSGLIYNKFIINLFF